jgi:hypothetical protein
MAEELTDEMIKSAYASEVQPDAVLLEITADNLLEPIYVCDHPEGVLSNGVFYPFYPFTVVLGGASMDEPVKGARLEIANLDGHLTLAARTVMNKPKLNAKVVRLNNPDLVEQEFVGVVIDDVEIDDQHLTFSLSPRTFKTEAACTARYIMARTPGLF